ncbi:MAG: cold shock domain-containing protein [Desulfobulbaceae bacterium]|nr:cold shock domain-containing protein [Desulfobulbaceae bacterium]HIJ89747.1 HPF/RaiA family ribosome-associated protein [Deltaproteobacteria bacterium]
MELQVEGRNLEIRKAWQEKIEEEKGRLDRHHPGLVHHLRISIEETAGHKAGGHEVRMVASIPNDTVVVKRKGETVRPLLVDAFDTLGLQLKELQRKRRQTVKEPEGAAVGPAMGTIKSLFPYESYGFLMTMDGQEVYFHENALKDVTMAQLTEGDEVRFGVGEGDKGPTAAWVKLVK